MTLSNKFNTTLPESFENSLILASFDALGVRILSIHYEGNNANTGKIYTLDRTMSCQTTLLDYTVRTKITLYHVFMFYIDLHEATATYA